MNPKFVKLTEAIVIMERLSEKYNPNDTESLSMLNMSIHSNEFTLLTAKESDHNKEYAAIFEALEKRIEAVKAKIKL